MLLLCTLVFSACQESKFIQVSAGEGFTCALREDGTVVCRGMNDWGQSRPPEDVRFKSISSGGHHTCGLQMDGKAVCWGDLTPQSTWRRIVPTHVRFSTVSVGGGVLGFSCGLTADGAARCWRVIDSDQLVDGHLVSLSVGGQQICGLRKDGFIDCWRTPYTSDPFSKPPTEGGFQAISVAASGVGHACGLKENGSVVCWGQNRYGQAYPPDNERFKDLSTGGNFTCGLRQNGLVVCWGNDQYDQSSPPQNERFVSIATGMRHACGLKETGVIMCWGDDRQGQSPSSWR